MKVGRFLRPRAAVGVLMVRGRLGGVLLPHWYAALFGEVGSARLRWHDGQDRRYRDRDELREG